MKAFSYLFIAMVSASAGADCGIFLKDPRPQPPQGFQILQLIHGESVPGNLLELSDLSENQIENLIVSQTSGRRLLLAEAAAVQQASLALKKLANNQAYVLDVYKEVFETRFATMGLDPNTPQGLALARLAAMMELNTPEEVQAMVAVYRSLPDRTQNTFELVLNRTGIGDSAFVLTYANAFFSSLFDQVSPRPAKVVERITRAALPTLAPLFLSVDRQLNSKGWWGPFAIDADGLLMGARAPDRGLFVKNLRVEWMTNRVKLIPRRRIHLKKFTELESLKDVPGERVAILPLRSRRDRTPALALQKIFSDAGRSAFLTNIHDTRSFDTVVVVGTAAELSPAWSVDGLLKSTYKAIVGLRGQRFVSAFILAGTDSEKDSETALLKMQARPYWLKPEEIQTVTQVLSQQPMSDERLQQIWELSLKGYFGGPFVLNVKEQPYQFLDEAMGRIFFTGLTPPRAKP
jgi:hypothetical protein